MNKFKYFIITILLISLCGCSKKIEDSITFSELKYISELATIKVYYHNVAEKEKPAGTSLLNIFEKNRLVWIEYTGSAKIGINMNKVDIKINGDKVKITMPKAEVLSIDIDKLEKDKYIYSLDSGINSNEITAEDEREAINEAQENMKKTILNDEQLLLKAQDRAKELIKNYINKFNTPDKEYKIEWVELKESM